MIASAEATRAAKWSSGSPAKTNEPTADIQRGKVGRPGRR